MNNDLKRILIVDDEEAILFAFKRVLDAPGLEVHTAETMAQALDLIEQNAYAVVIADLRLSGTTCDEGFTVIKIVAEKQEECKIIVMTAYGSVEIAVEAMKLGVSDYLIKDLEGGFVNVLPLVVARAIQQRRLLEEKERMEKELVRVQRLEGIGQLAAGIAHEINTPTQYLGDNTRFLQGAFADIGT